MICPTCGSQVGDNAKFCENCGASLDLSQPAAPTGAPTIPAKSNGKAIGALVCGILAIVFAESIIIGIVLGIVAIVLAAQAAKDGPDGKAKAGKICGIIGLVLSALMLVAGLATGFAVFKYVEQNPSIIADLSTSSSTEKSSKASSGAPSSSSKSSSSSSSSKVPEPTKYTNARFGFSLSVPQGFEKTAESQNGDGATFYNKELKMTVYVSGYNNINDLTAEQIIETSWNGDKNAKKEHNDTEALLYQTEGSDDVIHCWYVGKGSVNEMLVKYPSKKDNSTEQDMVSQLVGGFEPGGIASTH